MLNLARVWFVGFVNLYGRLTELPEVSGSGMEVLQNSQKSRAGTKHAVPVPRVLWHGSYRLTEKSGTCMKVLQVRVRI